jgi:hypothetical protein
MPPPVYRYDEQEYAPGKVIQSRGDHIHGLTAQQRAAEEAIRNVSGEWERIRSKSLYVWKDLTVAEKLWRNTKGQEHLYELSIKPDDIELVGDLTYFNMIEETVGRNVTADEYAIRQYLNQRSAKSYVEILVKKATVTRKLFDCSQKVLVQKPT